MGRGRASCRLSIASQHIGQGYQVLVQVPRANEQCQFRPSIASETLIPSRRRAEMTSSGGGFSDWEMSEKKEAGIEHVEICRKPPSPSRDLDWRWCWCWCWCWCWWPGARFGWHLASKRCGRKTGLLGTEIERGGLDWEKAKSGPDEFRSIPFVICAASSKAQEFQALAVDLMPASPVEVRRVSWRCSRVDGAAVATGVAIVMVPLPSVSWCLVLPGPTLWTALFFACRGIGAGLPSCCSPTGVWNWELGPTAHGWCPGKSSKRRRSCFPLAPLQTSQETPEGLPGTLGGRPG
ncbi:hypothetical protein CMUS01_09042 [Colletotrichum musicola]|uniref:Uncharacterized protein n=1 Tax=Colletotrichum musicola TaxID=2175873 RepID=A0A8H6NC94_9PEZI|nr:hypothetical protein CMUS01_09042 [Colletotrichum musicola]